MRKGAVFLISLTRRHIVNSLLPARRKDLEDLKKPGLGRPYSDSLDLQREADTSIPLVARIEWCRRQRREARTQADAEGWRAEEEGLRDAFLDRDRRYPHQYRSPIPFDVFGRYAMGLEDGRTLMRLGRLNCMWHPAANGTHV